MRWDINQFRERAERTRTERGRRRQALLVALTPPGTELYCVEAATALGLGPRGFSAAKSLLKVLEREGLVVGETRPAPNRRGPGRRYYRLARAADETA